MISCNADAKSTWSQANIDLIQPPLPPEAGAVLVVQPPLEL